MTTVADELDLPAATEVSVEVATSWVWTREREQLLWSCLAAVIDSDARHKPKQAHGGDPYGLNFYNVLTGPPRHDGTDGQRLEVAVHLAVARGGEFVRSLVQALRTIGMDVEAPQSIALLTDDAGHRQLAAGALEARLSRDARVVTGQRGQRPLLRPRLEVLPASYDEQDPAARAAMLGISIADLAFADLLVGNDDGSQWTGVSCKNRPRLLGHALPGVPIGVTVDLRRSETEVTDLRPTGPVTVVVGKSAQLWASFTVALDVIRTVADIVNHRADQRYVPGDRSPYAKQLLNRTGLPTGEVISFCRHQAGDDFVELESGFLVAAAPRSLHVGMKVLAELAA